MDNLKCRAKRIGGKGGWIEGYYSQQKDTTYCFKEDNDRHSENTKHYITFDQMTDWGLPNEHLTVEVDPSTICRYTGVYAKWQEGNNGKFGPCNHTPDIWEHDLLQIKHSDMTELLEVCFENGMFVLKRVKSEPSLPILVGPLFSYVKEESGYYYLECKVLGNTFDTPGLVAKWKNCDK